MALFYIVPAPGFVKRAQKLALLNPAKQGRFAASGRAHRRT